MGTEGSDEVRRRPGPGLARQLRRRDDYTPIASKPTAKGYAFTIKLRTYRDVTDPAARTRSRHGRGAEEPKRRDTPTSRCSARASAGARDALPVVAAGAGAAPVVSLVHGHEAGRGGRARRPARLRPSPLGRLVACRLISRSDVRATGLVVRRHAAPAIARAGTKRSRTRKAPGSKTGSRRRRPCRCPTLHFQGEVDGINPPSASRSVPAKFTRPFEMVTLPGVGHSPQREAPDEVAAKLVAHFGPRWRPGRCGQAVTRSTALPFGRDAARAALSMFANHVVCFLIASRVHRLATSLDVIDNLGGSVCPSDGKFRH